MKPSHSVFLAVCFSLANKVLTKQFKFGHSIKTDNADNLDVIIFEMILLQDIQNCIESCRTRKQCTFFNFDHQAKVCYLIRGNDTILPEKKPGFSFGNKADWNMTEYEACGNCSDYGVCKKDGEGKYSKCLHCGCGPPAKKNNAILRGNMFLIGDKIHYECEKRYKTNQHISFTSTCLNNGTWSPVDIKCVLEDYVYRLNNIFYTLIPQTLAWNDAKVKCTSIGGYLTDIKSQEEQNFIEGQVRKETVNFSCFWTGGRRVGNDIWLFKWLDHTVVDYSYWSPGEPGSSEPCLAIQVVYDYKWNDKPCYWKCSSICKLI